MQAPSLSNQPAPPRFRPCEGPDAADPRWSEWVLANGLGGFAMGSASGTPTRRYHTLLTAALKPPVQRIAALNAVADRFTMSPGWPAESAWWLTPFQFSGAEAAGSMLPVTFEREAGLCRWRYALPSSAGPGAVLEKTLTVADGRNAAALRYEVRGVVGAWRLEVKPLVSLRDFHGLLPGGDIDGRLSVLAIDGGCRVADRGTGLRLLSAGMGYEPLYQPWHGFWYAWEARRGGAASESLLCPGVFTLTGTGAGGAELFAAVDDGPAATLDDMVRQRRSRVGPIATAAAATATTPADREALAALAWAADDFVVRRGEGEAAFTSVIAGYPWFSDWGRDTMIALPGLMLATGRYAEALSALRVFAEHLHKGLIPNRFDDYAGAAHYNTVDAPLWFLHAAAEYRRLSGDRAGYAEHLAPACVAIVEAYRDGTEYGIGMDNFDGLIRAGNAETQLTWMDAQRDGVTFTPRFGKAVEVNALWGHGLAVTAEALAEAGTFAAGDMRDMARRVKASFTKAFSDPATGGLHDCLVPVERIAGRPVWTPTGEIRPNQIFAVSLSHSPLEAGRRAGVVAAVRSVLLTRHGLRTLAPGSPGYVGRLGGGMFERDAAYHNGTVWPWLMGPYAEAVLRAGGFSGAARAEARAALAPLVAALGGPHAMALAEIYDGDDAPDAPQRPDGCVQQAWSVAEVLRVLRLVVEGGGQ